MAEAAQPVLVNLRPPGRGWAESCVAIPPHQIIPHLPRSTFQRGPGGRTLQGETSSYRQQPAFVQEAAVLQTKERQHHPSWRGRSRGPRRQPYASHHPTNSSPYLQVQGEIHLCHHQQQREERLCRGMGKERQHHRRVPSGAASGGRGGGRNKAIFGVTNEPWGARP